MEQKVARASRTAGPLAVLITATFALAGCGAGAEPAGELVETPIAAPPSAAAQGHGHGHGHGSHGGDPGGVALWAVQSGPLGVVVTDGAGRLLYRSDRDLADPPTSNCTGDCAATWQPLIVQAGEQPVLSGVNRSKIGTVRRADGAAQLTLAGWPLYLHAGEPGGLQDAGSHGADGTWFAATPTGEKASAP